MSLPTRLNAPDERAPWKGGLVKIGMDKNILVETLERLRMLYNSEGPEPGILIKVALKHFQSPQFIWCK